MGRRTRIGPLLATAILIFPASAASASPASSAVSGDGLVALSEVLAAPPVAWEPVVATHPTDPSRLAVVVDRLVAGQVDPSPLFSDDGGRTWHTPAAEPWAGSGRYPDQHAAVAWGPGPSPGSARLYWADMTSDGRGFSPSVAWTDDDGAHWSSLYVERRTPPWVGGMVDVAVDRDPDSPSYGTVYVAYNWLASSHGPGLHVLASSDFGRTFAQVEVPRAPAPSGLPDVWRIGYRLAPAPDGSVYVAGFEADLSRWDPGQPFSRGTAGRLGWTVTRLRYLPAARRFALGPTVMAVTLTWDAYSVSQSPAPGTSGNVYVDPGWQAGLGVDPYSGRVLLAVGDVRDRSVGSPRGVVVVARSDDRGRTWSAVTLAPAPTIGDRPVSSFRPELVVLPGDEVWVGVHTIVDLPYSAGPADPDATLGTAWAVSADDGLTFAAPVAIDGVRWPAASLTRTIDGPGLRDGAAAAADGSLFYAWADGRLAAPAPSPAWGASAVVVAHLLFAAATFRGGAGMRLA